MRKQFGTGYDTAEMLEGVHCRCCGWPIIELCCNLSEPYIAFDWWVYCCNPTCQHHHGEGVFQEQPSWIVKLESNPSCDQ